MIQVIIDLFFLDIFTKKITACVEENDKILSFPNQCLLLPTSLLFYSHNSFELKFLSYLSSSGFYLSLFSFENQS
ncbi:hypothetical protein RIF29_39078 [Crotalaria pallida]|uniref:Uncharacterized protein n=1 Tax=Crotalaria pallida TaxID=3830 RepID=A0AAN9HPB3_CROPI